MIKSIMTIHTITIIEIPKELEKKFSNVNNSPNFICFILAVTSGPTFLEASAPAWAATNKFISDVLLTLTGMLYDSSTIEDIFTNELLIES